MGARALVSLIEPHEFEQLSVTALPEQARACGLVWHHLPIRDRDIPDAAFEARWVTAGARLHALLGEGERIVLHCMGGLGRTGTIAARLLIERGVEPRTAIQLVRFARPGAIETAAQERYVLGLRPGTRAASL